MKQFSYIIPFIIAALFACSSSRTPRAPKRDVPMAINIRMENSATINFINTNFFRFQLIQDLDQFQAVDFTLVGNDENPEVVVDVDITNFTLWPRDERLTRRRISRNVVVGTNSAGKPVYQTVTAIVDIVQIQRRSNARFDTRITVKGNPGLNFERVFAPSYNYVNTYVDNIQGDARAVDPLMLSRGISIEPNEDDFILLLARREMIRRLSSELRKYYDSKARSAG